MGLRSSPLIEFSEVLLRLALKNQEC